MVLQDWGGEPHGVEKFTHPLSIDLGQWVVDARLVSEWR